jgi:hypothetical protein
MPALAPLTVAERTFLGQAPIDAVDPSDIPEATDRRSSDGDRWAKVIGSRIE